MPRPHMMPRPGPKQDRTVRAPNSVRPPPAYFHSLRRAQPVQPEERDAQHQLPQPQTQPRRSTFDQEYREFKTQLLFHLKAIFILLATPVWHCLMFLLEAPQFLRSLRAEIRRDGLLTAARRVLDSGRARVLDMVTFAYYLSVQIISAMCQQILDFLYGIWWGAVGWVMSWIQWSFSTACACFHRIRTILLILLGSQPVTAQAASRGPSASEAGHAMDKKESTRRDSIGTSAAHSRQSSHNRRLSWREGDSRAAKFLTKRSSD